MDKIFKIVDVIGLKIKVYKDGKHIVNSVNSREYKQYVDTSGYYYVAIKFNGKRKNMYVHRLVAIAFIPNPANKPQVNHIDEIINHNDVHNLEWVTNYENSSYGHHNINVKNTLTNRYGVKCYVIDHNNSDKIMYFSSISSMCSYIEKSSGYVTTMFKNNNNKFTINSLGFTLVRS